MVAVGCTGEQPATGDDRWQVWVCEVPAATTHRVYAAGPWGTDRLDLSPVELARVLEAHVTPWFDQVSHGQHRFAFEPGGRIALGADEGPGACLDRALAGAAAPSLAAPGRSAPVTGVLAVADAAHALDEPGGFGRAGSTCGAGTCAAHTTGRGAYVGAADFHPDWGEVPLLDLVEHELGHALGWRHSGQGPAGEYLSAIDLMSDSAGLRALDPSRVHGPPPLAEHRAQVGWIPPGDVVELAPGTAAATRVELRPSTDPGGSRLLRLGVDQRRWIAVEVLDDTGFSPLEPGVTLHVVDSGEGGDGMRITPLLGAPPHTELLRAGDRWSDLGWTVTVDAAPGGATDGPWILQVGPAISR